MAIKEDDIQKNFTSVKDEIMDRLNELNSHDPDLSPVGHAAVERIVALLQDLGEVVKGRSKGVQTPIPQSEVDEQEGKSKDNKWGDTKKAK